MTPNAFIRQPKPAATPVSAIAESDFGLSREYPGNRLVYTVISSRAGGLCIGINMNPDKYCNFNCAYCETDRRQPAMPTSLDVNVMADELDRMLELVHSGELTNFSSYHNTPEDLMGLRQVLLSGDGEPTMCANFLDAIRGIVHLRALGKHPFFKIALLTNATGLDLRPVQDGLRLFTKHDEIWVKLDAGSQHYFETVNGSNLLLDKILENILMIGRERRIVIQSLFPRLAGSEPSEGEIESYVWRLNDLKRAGAQISLVQVCSANRQPANPRYGHLPLKALVKIARRIREVTGLKAEVF